MSHVRRIQNHAWRVSSETSRFGHLGSTMTHESAPGQRGDPHPWATDVGYLTTFRRRTIMAEEFEYISQARLEYRDGYRYAYLGEVPEPVVYGVQGALREYYGAKEGPPIASTLDHIVAAVAG
jgi:hypothetical protein